MRESGQGLGELVAPSLVFGLEGAAALLRCSLGDRLAQAARRLRNDEPIATRMAMAAPTTVQAVASMSMDPTPFPAANGCDRATDDAAAMGGMTGRGRERRGQGLAGLGPPACTGLGWLTQHPVIRPFTPLAVGAPQGPSPRPWALVAPESSLLFL